MKTWATDRLPTLRPKRILTRPTAIMPSACLLLILTMMAGQIFILPATALPAFFTTTITTARSPMWRGWGEISFNKTGGGRGGRGGNNGGYKGGGGGGYFEKTFFMACPTPPP